MFARCIDTCDGGLVCYKHRCRKALGHSCTYDSECSGGLYCNNYTCSKDKPIKHIDDYIKEPSGRHIKWKEDLEEVNIIPNRYDQ